MTEINAIRVSSYTEVEPRAGISAGMALSGPNQVGGIRLTGLEFALLVAMAAGWVFGNRSLKGQIESLVLAIQQLAKGNLKTRLNPPSGRDEVDQLTQAFNEMAEAMERREAQRHRVEKVQAAIYRITEAAVYTQSMDELYRSIHQSLGELMPVENFYIALYDPASDMISFPYFVDQFDPPGPPVKAGRGLTEYVLRTGHPLLASPQVFHQLVEQGEVELVGTDSVDWLGRL
jgi:HAMP domain-containing protein